MNEAPKDPGNYYEPTQEDVGGESNDFTDTSSADNYTSEETTNAQSFGEKLANREEVMAGIIQSFEDSVSSVDRETPARPDVYQLDEMEKNIFIAQREARATLCENFSEVARLAIENLSEADKKSFEGIARMAKTFGLIDESAQEAVVLDNVFDDEKQQKDNSHIGEVLRERIQSDEARIYMNAALDEARFFQAEKSLNDGQIDKYFSILQNMSDQDSRRASHLVLSSGYRISEAMEGVSGHQGKVQWGRYRKIDTQWGKGVSELHIYSAIESLATKRWYANFRQQQADDRQSSEQQTAPPVVNEKSDAPEFVQEFVEKNRNASWLLDVPNETINEVISEVEELRTNGITSSKKIYAHFSRAFQEKTVSDPSASQFNETKAKIVLAFMKGDFREGRLPF